MIDPDADRAARLVAVARGAGTRGGEPALRPQRGRAHRRRGTAPGPARASWWVAGPRSGRRCPTSRASSWSTKPTRRSKTSGRPRGTPATSRSSACGAPGASDPGRHSRAHRRRARRARRATRRRSECRGRASRWSTRATNGPGRRCSRAALADELRRVRDAGRPIGVRAEPQGPGAAARVPHVRRAGALRAMRRDGAGRRRRSDVRSLRHGAAADLPPLPRHPLPGGPTRGDARARRPRGAAAAGDGGRGRRRHRRGARRRRPDRHRSRAAPRAARPPGRPGGVPRARPGAARAPCTRGGAGAVAPRARRAPARPARGAGCAPAPDPPARARGGGGGASRRAARRGRSRTRAAPRCSAGRRSVVWPSSVATRARSGPRATRCAASAASRCSDRSTTASARSCGPRRSTTLCDALGVARDRGRARARPPPGRRRPRGPDRAPSGSFGKTVG